MTISWNYQQIQLFTRQISGQLDANLLSNTALGFHINNAYQYTLPREIKPEELYVQYTFSTIPGQADYILPGDYSDQFAQAFTHTEPKIYINGQPIFYTQDTNIFYKKIPMDFAEETLGYGTGAQTVFNYTTNQNPIVSGQISSVMITDGSEVYFDNGSGNLVNSSGSVQGTVVYSTGVIAITFITAPANQQAITVNYHFTQLGRPQTCLFYNRTFSFYPVPSTTFQVRIDAYQQPAVLVNPSDVPIKPEWSEAICCLAAMTISRNYGQFDKYKECEQYWLVERSKLMSDTDNQYMATRTNPSC